jgi:hypothetical protein
MEKRFFLPMSAIWGWQRLTAKARRQQRFEAKQSCRKIRPSSPRANRDVRGRRCANKHSAQFPLAKLQLSGERLAARTFVMYMIMHINHDRRVRTESEWLLQRNA